MFCSDEVSHRVVARDEGGMNRICGKKVAIAGTQGVSFVTDAQLELATDDPVRLIFTMRVRTILSSGRIAPLKHAVAFALELLAQFSRVRSRGIIPSFDLHCQLNPLAAKYRAHRSG